MRGRERGKERKEREKNVKYGSERIQALMEKKKRRDTGMRKEVKMRRGLREY